MADIQLVKKTEFDNGMATKADKNHTHTDYAPILHNHDDRYYTETEVNDLMSTKADKAQVDAGLAEKANASHSHTIANITGLQEALDDKLASGALGSVEQVADPTAATLEELASKVNEILTALKA